MTLGRSGLFATLVAPLFAALLPGCGIGKHAVRQHGASEQPAVSWNEVLRKPSALRVTAYVTGFVKTGPKILIRRDPQIPASELRERWVPSIAYLIEHPDGNILVDTGVTGEQCGYGLRPFFWVPCRSTRTGSALAQMRAGGVDPSNVKYVLVSHFHGDHIGALSEVVAATGAPVVVTAREWNHAQKWTRATHGYLRRQIHGDYDVELLAGDHPIDFFGDGSVWILPTPGHTRGHLSVLLNVEAAPILLTIDVAHIRAGFENRVIPGFVVDEAAAQQSLEQLADLRRDHPAVRVYYGHEPTQWPSVPGAVILAGPSR